MTVTLHLDDAVAEALAAEAARRGQTADELAAALLAAQLPKAPRRRLTFAAVGASASGRRAAPGRGAVGRWGVVVGVVGRAPRRPRGAGGARRREKGRRALPTIAGERRGSPGH